MVVICARSCLCRVPLCVHFLHSAGSYHSQPTPFFPCGPISPGVCHVSARFSHSTLPVQPFSRLTPAYHSMYFSLIPYSLRVTPRQGAPRNARSCWAELRCPFTCPRGQNLPEAQDLKGDGLCAHETAT